MNDRLDWIFETDASNESLEARYDRWAATYNADHDEWGWQGPSLVAETALRLGGDLDERSVCVDAGCGTGKAGLASRAAGFGGRMIGPDLSHKMLDAAAMQLIRTWRVLDPAVR